MNLTHAVRKALKRLRYPDVDSDGNLEASVAPRRDTLANLVTVADGGDGETALATDQDAFVVYGADGLHDFNVYPNRRIEVMSPHGGAALIAAGASMNLPIVTAAALDPYGLIDGVNDVINQPAHFSTYSSSDAFLEVELHCIISLGTTTPTVKIQVYNSTGGGWLDFSGDGNFNIENTKEGIWVKKTLTSSSIGIGFGEASQYRILVTNIDTVDQYIVQPALKFTFVDAKQ